MMNKHSRRVNSFPVSQAMWYSPDCEAIVREVAGVQGLFDSSRPDQLVSRVNAAACDGLARSSGPEA